MAKKWVCCLAEDGTQACRIIERLQLEGFSNNDISILLPDKEKIGKIMGETGTKAPEGVVAGASTGIVLGGVLGLLTGIGALVLPGLGPFVAAGPMIAALSGVAAGGVAGGLVGRLIGLGLPEYEAKRYERGLREGRILLAVYSETSEEIKRAENIFERAGAQHISSSCEKVVSVKNRAAQPHRKAA